MNEEIGDQVWRTVNGWRDTVTAADVHASALRDARAELEAAWPPDGSEASRLFLIYVDELIASMETTSSRASKNYTALVQIVNAVVKAKAEIKPLYEQWVRLNPAGDPGQYAPLEGEPKTAAQKLVADAVKAMDAADVRISEAADTMQAPPKYDPQIWKDEPPSADSGSGGLVGAGASGAAVGVGYSASYVMSPEIPVPAASATLAGSSGALVGSSGALAPGSQVGSSVAGSTSGGGLPGRVLGHVPAVGAVGMGVSAGRFGASRVMPPGGLIGGQLTPGAGRGSGVSRMMPPGGVLGGSSQGQAGRGTAPPIGTGGRAREEEQRQQFDPDSPWQVEQGGPSVLEAPVEPLDHDPGAGVIGIDR
ncbi:MAG: hypothetical protein HKP61_12315 [Dactylosporangium sp.]|nr:hypothetical protein [Dactylosporangium sp.]NNJ61703.1 hypothetical protein [Dactylosporangium sp.]